MLQEFTINLTAKALDGLALQTRITANNIANINTLGYHRLAVNFEKQLAKAQTLQDLKEFNPVINHTLSPVSLDQELATSLQTTTHYRALIRGLNQTFSLLHLAINGSRS